MTTLSKDPEPVCVPSRPWRGLFSGRADLENDSSMRALIVLAVDTTKNTLSVPFNDEEALTDLIEKEGENIACIIKIGRAHV